MRTRELPAASSPVVADENGTESSMLAAMSVEEALHFLTGESGDAPSEEALLALGQSKSIYMAQDRLFAVLKEALATTTRDSESQVYSRFVLAFGSLLRVYGICGSAMLSSGAATLIRRLCLELARNRPASLLPALRSTSLAIALGRQVGCSEEEVRILEIGSCLHDLGKLSLPESMFATPAPFTPEDRAAMQTHTQAGALFAEGLGLPKPAVDIVAQHHEQWRGDGYPAGLKGQEITLLARVVSIADALEAMVSGRPYQPAVSPEEALRRLQQAAGTQFDPLYVDSMVNLVRRERRLLLQLNPRLYW